MPATPTYDESILSDLYKDATGHRPRELFWARWNESTPDEKQAIWDGLCRDVEASIAREEAEHQAAIASYEASLTTLVASGAGDRETAKRWLIQSLGDRFQDGGHVCWELGLPFRMASEFDGLV